MLDLERYEMKYRLNYKDALLIRKRMEFYIEPDPHAENGPYLVRSVYFDTLFNGDFYAREMSLTHRHHIRLRTYPQNPGKISLELKEKNGVTIRKRILPVTRREAESLLHSEYGVLRDHKDPFARMLYRKMTMDIYRPCVLIEYQRMAYARQENDTRVTFDFNIRSSESDLDLFGSMRARAPVGPQGQVIMELKYTDFFMSDLNSAIGTRQLRAEAAGKYQRARMIAMSGRNIL